jgi:hypothetical protein
MHPVLSIALRVRLSHAGYVLALGGVFLWAYGALSIGLGWRGLEKVLSGAWKTRTDLPGRPARVNVAVLSCLSDTMRIPSTLLID